MNARYHFSRARLRQCGYSLVELMVAIAIALFLIAGVIVIEQSMHNSYSDRSGLAKLDDDERFTMTLLTEIAQTAGYYPDPASTSLVTAFPQQSTTVPNAAADALTFASGQAVYGLHKTTSVGGSTYSVDTLAIRYMTASGDGIPLCDGSTNNTGANTVYTNYFYIETQPDPDPSKPADSFLYCDLEINNAWSASGPVQLVKNVEFMQIWYGLHVAGQQPSTPGDNSVNLYVPSANMQASDWSEVTAIRIQVTFANPLQNEAGQPQYVTFTKVLDVMSRAGGT